MDSRTLRRKYIDFFVQKHAHAEISGASLIPENDPTVLFTTAGMHPLVPYLMGETHPQGARLVDVQKCLRTDDIDEVGDTTHLTFFEMLGNWSLGDYFKKEAIKMSYEFLTEELGLDPDKLSVSCFIGDDDCPKDEEAAQAWEELGFSREGDKKRIYFFGKKENWWGPAGLTGPCGPDTEMFFEMDQPKCGEGCDPSCDCGKFVEIWNDVFMQYNKTSDGKFEPLAQKNVDTGLGLDRVTAIMQGVPTVFETDLFVPIIDKIRELVAEEDVISFRIIADHLRAATFILADPQAVRPSNTDQGYVLRRLIRRAIRHGMKLGIEGSFAVQIAEVIIENYKEVYPELERSRDFIRSALTEEETKFSKTLGKGEREFEKMMRRLEQDGIKSLTGEMAFKLYDTYGFPLEMTQELAEEHGLEVDCENYEECFKKHQEKSRAGAAAKFSGGLQDDHAETVKLHTATHLLQAALREIVGDHVYQKGSNITHERLRFDFTNSEGLTPEQKEAVTARVNEIIEADLPITFQMMNVDEAKESGAIGVFPDRYNEKIKVYTVEGFSKEICGGPHVASTGVLGIFKIKKEQSSGAGVRRIKATLRDGAEEVPFAEEV
jgi:alanyl-tRNA synthetase